MKSSFIAYVDESGDEGFVFEHGSDPIILVAGT